MWAFLSIFNCIALHYKAKNILFQCAKIFMTCCTMTVLDLRENNDCKRREFMLISIIAPLVLMLRMHCILWVQHLLHFYTLLHRLMLTELELFAFTYFSYYHFFLMSFASRTKLIHLSIISFEL